MADWLTGRTWTKERAPTDSAGKQSFVVSAAEAAPTRGGREILRFSEDGRFVMSLPGPDDRPRTYEGAWSRADERTVRLRFDDESLHGTVTLESAERLSLSLTGGDAPSRR